MHRIVPDSAACTNDVDGGDTSTNAGFDACGTVPMIGHAVAEDILCSKDVVDREETVPVMCWNAANDRYGIAAMCDVVADASMCWKASMTEERLSHANLKRRARWTPGIAKGSPFL